MTSSHWTEPGHLATLSCKEGSFLPSVTMEKEEMDFRGKPSRLFHNLPGPLEAVISNCDAWSGWDYLAILLRPKLVLGNQKSER